MSNRNFATYREIMSQTEAWAQAIAQTRSASLPDASKYGQVVFTGCGSTYYLSVAAAALFQELTGYPARAVPAGELLLNTKSVLTDEKTLLIAVSRSGTTTETVCAVGKFKQEKRGDLLVI